MRLSISTRRLARKAAASFSSLSRLPELESAPPFLKTVGYVSAGVGALALGVVVGREIRLRYKFNRRTPYDFYAHSGDRQEMDFGLGT